jgi:hypothetical protein
MTDRLAHLLRWLGLFGEARRLEFEDSLLAYNASGSGMFQRV